MTDTPALSAVKSAARDWRSAVIQDFARSALFQRTFQEGMDLVEETASYLDGAGRQASKALHRDQALAYASESMRLTTRLMQVASWLLVQRAVREGDMAPASACEERYRLTADDAREDAEVTGLPHDLAGLLARSEQLYERVRHLDRRMYVEHDADEAAHPVLAQHDRLKSAFGA